MDDENASKKKKRDFQEKLLAYSIDIKLSTNTEKAAVVSKSLLKKDGYQSFLHKALNEQHYLEIVSYWIVNCVPDNSFAELKEVLQDCQLHEYCLAAYKFDHITSFYALKDKETLSYEHRDKIYDCITQECVPQARYIGLFLLSLREYIDKYVQNSKQEDLLSAIMQEVREKYSPSWACLKALFTYIGREKFVEKIEREILSEGDMTSSVNLSLVVNKAESVKADYEVQVARTDPKVLVYTCHKDVYEKVDLSGQYMPKTINLVRSGKMVPLSVSFQTYMDCCIKFLEEYFKIDINNMDSIAKEIRFPPSYMISDEVSKLVDRFHIDHTVVVTHYDVMEHCKLFKFNLDEISKNFQIDFGLVGNGDKQIILCNYKLNYLCVVHHSEAHDEEEALKDLKVGEHYFRLFFYLLSCILGKTFLYISVVAAPNITINCENPLILSESDIAAISERLKTISWEITRKKIEKPTTDPKVSSRTCLRFLSLLLAFVATTQVSPNVLYGSVAQKVLSVWLTTEQLEVVLSDNFWKIVVGGYGSGKTLTAQYLLKHLIRYSTMKTDIYFVLFDNSSLLMKSMEEYCENLRMQFRKDGSDVNLICHNAEGIGEFLKDEMKELYSDSSGSIDFTISNMLLAIKQRSRKTGRHFHLIVDEVDAEVINEVEATNLKKIFSDHRDELKESHVLFLLRSMEKRREYISKGMSYMHKSYQYYHDCGMKLAEITHSVRVPVQVFEIMKLCMDGITTPTVIPYPGIDSKREPSPKVEQKKISITDARSFSMVSNSEVSPQLKQAEIFNTDADSFSSLVNVDSSLSLYPTRSNVNGGSVSNQIKSRFEIPHFEWKHDDPNAIDELAKECAEKYEGSTNKMETQYIFQKCKYMGHKIYGLQPELIFLNLDGVKELEKTEKVTLLSIALKKVFLSEATVSGGKKLVVCINQEDFDLCKSVKTLNNETTFFYNPEKSNAESMDQFLIIETIVTNYTGSRGLESPLVIVITNPCDYFKRQYFIEMVSRCTDHLVLIVPYLYKREESASKERETVRNMLELLIDSKKSILQITSYKLDGTLDSEDPFQSCSSENRMWTEIKINKNNENYCNFEPQNDIRSQDIVKFDVNLLSNYGPPEAVVDVSTKRLSTNIVEFSWIHPSKNFRLEIGTQPVGTYQIIDNLQGCRYQLLGDDSCTYILKLYAVNKYNGLLSSPCEIFYSSKGNKDEDHDIDAPTHQANFSAYYIDTKNSSKKKRDFQEKLLAYNIDTELSTYHGYMWFIMKHIIGHRHGKVEEVFKSLLKHDAYQPFLCKDLTRQQIVSYWILSYESDDAYISSLIHDAYQPFLNEALPKRHYLEIVSYWIANYEPDDAFAELNEVLRNCQLEQYCLTADEFDHITPFYNLKDEGTLNNEHREEIYDRITRECIHQARYIGLFLLSCEDYLAIYMYNSNQELIDAIMMKVRESYCPSWECLKALFTYIGKEKFAEKIEKVIQLVISDEVSELADQFHIDYTVVVTHYDVMEHCKLFKFNLDEISKNNVTLDL